MNQGSRLRYTGGMAALLAATLIWGFAFSAQRSGVKVLPPFLFTSFRSILGGIVLFPVIALLDCISGVRHASTQDPQSRRTLLIGGVMCGLCLGTASLLQQWGMVYTPAGKGGFLTVLYIVFVPLLGGIFFRKKVSGIQWIAVLLAVTGTWVLCGMQNFLGSVGPGEILLLLCAVMFAGHILVVDRYSARTDGVRMACLQFWVTALVAGAVALLAGESADWSAVRQAAWPLLYCGIGSSGIAFTLQIVAQKHVPPVPAALAMSLESVFSVLGGYWFLGESMTWIELAGCAGILAGVLLAQKK